MSQRQSRRVRVGICKTTVFDLKKAPENSNSDTVDEAFMNRHGYFKCPVCEEAWTYSKRTLCVPCSKGRRAVR